MSKVSEYIKSTWNKLQQPFRLIVINPKTFEEKRNWEFSQGRLLVYALFVSILLVSSTFFIISYTPIKQLIKGYPSIEQTQKTIRQDKENVLKIEALLEELELKDNYLNNIVSALKGEEVLIDSSFSGKQSDVTISFPKSDEDSILRAQIEEEEKLNISSPITDVEVKIQSARILFYKPIDGKITDRFDRLDGHLGIDIIAPSDEPVKATLDGTVVFASWTVDDGHVIQIQHSNNIISVYKHNSVLLKSVGEIVYAGEPISFIGDSGELSDGPHLHFELWQNGLPLDPLNYINFSE